VAIFYATVLAASNPQLLATAEKTHIRRRDLEIGVANSDEYAESIVTIQAPKGPSLGISESDHEKIASILSMTREIISTAGALAENESTQQEVKDMLERANAVFHEVKDHIYPNVMLREEEENSQIDLRKTMLKEKFSNHDVRKAREDDERSLHVTRDMYETMINFPECLDRYFKDCLAIINRELGSLGLTNLEVIVYEKRQPNVAGYSDVVIVTNELADRVVGKSGDGIVSYPYIWNDAEDGPRTIGIDGKFDCLNFTPELCCSTIKGSVPNPDIQGKTLGCHIFVPFGGAGNPKRDDRVIINLSPDGRVHEAPIIQ